MNRASIILLCFLFTLLAACGGKTPTQPTTSSLPAPTNISVEYGDGSATVAWDTLLDERVAGYNVYKNGEQVNSAPVAPSGLGTQAVSRLSYFVPGLVNGQVYEFLVTTLEKGGAESVKPKPVTTTPKAGLAEIMVNPLTPATASPNQLPAGAQREIFFEVQKPGKITLDATFTGTDLALVLNGPGQLGHYGRVDGSGPLSLEYTVTADDLTKGTAWRATLVNFSSSAADGVQLNVNRPFVTGPGTDISATTVVNPATPAGATPNSLPADGTRELFFEVQRPGTIEVRAEFSGSDLALILNGPKQLGYYGRVDGSGPLVLSYTVTADDLKKGTAWRVRLKNFSGKAAEQVKLTLKHPNVAALEPGTTTGQILINPVTPIGATPNSLPAKDSREVFFEVRRPGKITVDATFAATGLALILNGPDQLNAYERVDGTGPLHLEYLVSADDVKKGTEWRLSLANFSGSDAQNVLIDIKYPTLVFGVEDTKPTPAPGSWGDPHLITFDGLKYDFQAVGEFILARSVSGDFEVQVRQEPWGSSNRVSVNRAVATVVDGHRLGFYLPNRVNIDGTATPVAAGATLPLGGGSLENRGGAYVVTYPSGEEVVVTPHGGHSGHISVRLQLAAARAGGLEGPLGNDDGDTANDIALRGGTVLSQPVVFTELVGAFADSWRVGAGESLFDYAAGESTDTFTDSSFPAALATTRDLSTGAYNAAKAVCEAAGVTDPIILDACILDLAVTGDDSFADAAAEQPNPAAELELALPDLQVVQALVFLAERCEPYQPVLNVVALVRNTGTASSPERLDVGVVGALDATGPGWGNGIGLPALAPGEESEVRFPIYYLIDDPAYMAGEHAFEVTVNRGGWFAESDTGNNRYSPNPTVTIPAGACSSDEAPTVKITTPAEDTGVNDRDFVYDGYDEAKKLWYKDVLLTGLATDPEDGELTGSALVWTTDQTDLQEAVLGTGKTVKVRLYSDACTGTRHEITLTATDSGGNTRTAVRRIFIWNLC